MLSHYLMSEFDPYADTSGILGSIGSAVSGAAKGVAKGVRKAAKGVGKGVSAAGSALGKVPVVGAGLKGAYNLSMAPVALATNIASGARIDKAVVGHFKNQIAAIKDTAPYVQTVISFVPGIGSGISGAIGASLALAEGKPITEALIAATRGALPGGPLAAAAFDVATAAAQGKHISDIALAAIPLPPAQKDILRQSLEVAKDIAAGKRVETIVLNRVNDNLKKLPAAVQTAAQVGIALGQGKKIQATMVASALGKSMPFPAAKSLLGATKLGIQKASDAAQALRNGSPVLKSAIASVGGQFRSGSTEQLGFNTAIAVLKKTSGNKQALGVARRALPTEGARRAFDSAIGTVAQSAARNPGALGKRAGSIFVPQLAKAKGVISPYAPNLKNAIDSIKRNPTLAAQHPMVLANKFGTTQQTILQALKRTGTERMLPWRALSPTAANFIAKWAPYSPSRALGFGTRDTAGLDETGTKYIVIKGDSPFKIAKQLTGNGNRWVELKALNKDKKPSIDKNVWVGEVLNIPADWQKPMAKPPVSPGPAVSSQPAPEKPSGSSVSAPQISVAPGILQAKSILVAWGKTDGINQAGVSDYGSTAADLSTDFGPRDSLQLKSFQNWNNKTGSDKLVVDGKLGPKSLAALQHWAETRAAQAVASSPIPVTSLPETVITVSPPVSSPGLPVVSAPVLPAPVVSTPPVPVVASPSNPATPASVAAASPGGSKMAPALIGAGIGGTLFGLPGAILGGIAGAAMA